MDTGQNSVCLFDSGVRKPPYCEVYNVYIALCVQKLVQKYVKMSEVV